MSIIDLCILTLASQLTTFRTQVLGESPSMESSFVSLWPHPSCSLHSLLCPYVAEVIISQPPAPATAAVFPHHCGHPRHRTVSPNKLFCMSLLVLVFYHSNRGITNTIRKTLPVNCFCCIKVIKKWK